MISITLLNGESAKIAPDKFVRIRQAFTPGELGAGAVSVVDAGDRFLVKDHPLTLVAALRKTVPTPTFTTPNGLDVHIVAGKVGKILPAVPADHHPQARAVLVLPDGVQQIRQTVEVATQMLAAAKAADHDEEAVALFLLGE